MSSSAPTIVHSWMMRSDGPVRLDELSSSMHCLLLLRRSKSCLPSLVLHFQPLVRHNDIGICPLQHCLHSDKRTIKKCNAISQICEPQPPFAHCRFGIHRACELKAGSTFMGMPKPCIEPCWLCQAAPSTAELPLQPSNAQQLAIAAQEALFQRMCMTECVE